MCLSVYIDIYIYMYCLVFVRPFCSAVLLCRVSLFLCHVFPLLCFTCLLTSVLPFLFVYVLSSFLYVYCLFVLSVFDELRYVLYVLMALFCSFLP